MKSTVTLPYVKETPGTVVYALKDITSEPVGQLYIRKKYLEKKNGQWPGSATITVEIEE